MTHGSDANGPPEWFDQRLLPALAAKRHRRRGRLHFLDALVFGALDLAESLHGFSFTRRHSWVELEGIVREDCARVREQGFVPDAVVGIHSGGAFLAGFVARELGVPLVDYVRVVHYPPVLGSMLLAFLTRSFRAPELEPSADGVDVTGRRVLVVDDQVCTGRSLALARDWLLQRGAETVKTYCLFSQHGYGVYAPATTIDFGGRRGVLIYAPWGDDP